MPPNNKTTSSSTTTQNEVNSGPYTEIKSLPILHIEINSTSTTHTTTKSISMQH